MQTIDFVKKKILIYGMGLSGHSCLNFLKKKNDVKIFDDNFSLKYKKTKNTSLVKTILLS